MANAPDANHGGDAILRLRARGKNRALVKFDSAAIKDAVGSSTIVSATLTFTVAKNWENWAATGSLALLSDDAPWTENAQRGIRKILRAVLVGRSAERNDNGFE